jgi:hypothetical protein
MLARWIRSGRVGPGEFDAASLRLAVAQPRQAAPILLWGEAEASYPFAAYRQFGVRAYLQDDALWLHGQRVAETSVALAGECVVVASAFLMSFPSSCVATPSRELEQAFRLRLEAQHGWQFEHSWPSGAELPALAAA